MRLPNGSGVSREAPAPFCEGLTGKFRGSTHHGLQWVLLQRWLEVMKRSNRKKSEINHKKQVLIEQMSGLRLPEVI